MRRLRKLPCSQPDLPHQKYMQAIQDQQEILGAIANMTIETYARESAVLHAQKLATRNGEAGAANAIAMIRVYMAGALERIESAARMVVVAASESDMLRSQMAILRRLCRYEVFNVVALRQANRTENHRNRHIHGGIASLRGTEFADSRCVSAPFSTSPEMTGAATP